MAIAAGTRRRIDPERQGHHRALTAPPIGHDPAIVVAIANPASGGERGLCDSPFRCYSQLAAAIAAETAASWWPLSGDFGRTAISIEHLQNGSDECSNSEPREHTMISSEAHEGNRNYELRANEASKDEVRPLDQCGRRACVV